MTKEEINTLRKLLNEKVCWCKERYPNVIIDEEIRLDASDGQFLTTEAEILVFNLPRDELHKLMVAWWAYEDLCDLIIPPVMQDDIYALIVKAREICPPCIYFGQEFPFRVKCTDDQSFQWFCKTFLDIPNRTACAYFERRNLHFSDLVTYPDEGPAREKPQFDDIIGNSKEDVMTGEVTIQGLVEIYRSQVVLAKKSGETKNLILDSYAFAINRRLCPVFHTDESFALDAGFRIKRKIAEEVIKYCDDKWTAGEPLSFYNLEDHFGRDARWALISILRYAALEQRFDKKFFSGLAANCPTEAHGLDDPFQCSEIGVV